MKKSILLFVLALSSMLFSFSTYASLQLQVINCPASGGGHPDYIKCTQNIAIEKSLNSKADDQNVVSWGVKSPFNVTFTNKASLTLLNNDGSPLAQCDITYNGSTFAVNYSEQQDNFYCYPYQNSNTSATIYVGYN